MKKIFICIPTLATAGAERFVTELACNLDKRDYSVSIVITKKLNIESAFYKKLISNNIRVIDAGDRKYFKSLIDLTRLFVKERPDIVHTNVGSALHVLLPQLLSGNKFRHLFTVHSMGYRIFLGLKKRIMKYCFTHQIIIPIAICDTVKKSIIDTYALSEDGVECVYNGVDTDYYFPSANKKTVEVSFVTVGTLYHIKNHAKLIDAFKIAHDKESTFKLKIVGDGVLKDELKNKIMQLGVNDSVIMYGNQNDVRRILQNSDVYCCTSNVEGLPISVLEAMACGLPVISTPAGGVVDIVCNDINGFIVNDIDEIADCMLELGHNVNLRKTMGVESRKIAQTHSMIQCAHEYEALYRKYTR